MKKVMSYIGVSLVISCIFSTILLQAADEVTGKVRLKIWCSGISIIMSFPGDGVAYFGDQIVNTSTCSYQENRRLEVKNIGSVNVTYQLKTGTAVLKDNSNVEVMYPATSVDVSSFVIYGIFQVYNQAPALDDYANDDKITTTYQSATDSVFAYTGSTEKGYNVSPGNLRNIKFRLDLPTALNNVDNYGKEVDIPIYIKAIQTP